MRRKNEQEFISDDEYKILNQDLLPSEKLDDYMLKDECGNNILSLKRFKLFVFYRRSISSIAKSLNVSIARVDHLIKLYQIPFNRRHIFKPRLRRKSRSKNKVLKPGFILDVTGKNYFIENDIRKVHGYYREYFVGEDGRRKSIFTHRKVVEDNIGRKLSKSEKVHHVNGDKKYNDIDNLYVCDSYEEHAFIHNSLDKLAYELVDLGIIKFANGEYFLEEGFYDDVERFNYKKRIFNENLEYYRGEQLKYDPVEDL